MKVAQISKPGSAFEIVERDIPEPEAGQVRFKMQACGMCHRDVLTKDGLIPDIQYPRIAPRVTATEIDPGPTINGGVNSGTGFRSLRSNIAKPQENVAIANEITVTGEFRW